MTKFLFLTILVVFSGIVFWSCSDEGSTDPSNQLPTCSISSPADFSSYSIGETISVIVSAEDPDGDIKEVRFYIDSVGVASVQTFPYNIEINTDDVLPGSHILQVVVEDDKGAETKKFLNFGILFNAPTQLEYNRIAQNSIEITWIDNSDGVEGFSIDKKSGNNEWQINYALINQNLKTWNDPYIIENEDNSYRVRSYFENYYSLYSDSVVVKRITPNMVFVQSDTFTMGDHFLEGELDELPLHEVSLGNYIINKFEITQAEWSIYMTSSNYSYGSGENYPVYYLNWYEIIKYCNLRSLAENLQPCYVINNSTDPNEWGEIPTNTNSIWNAVICNWEANGYRLPSEAEWEFASRGGICWEDNLRYSGSNNIDDVCWYFDNSEIAQSHPVGEKLPNQLGIYDMSGNIYEWCWDLYDETYYTTCYNLDIVYNPYGPNNNLNRILRGSSYANGGTSPCRVASRENLSPITKSHYIGFRVARTK